MDNKYLRVDGDGIKELYDLFNEDYIKYVDELNKYDLQLFLFELNNAEERDEQIYEYMKIYKFMSSLISLLNAEQDLF